MQRNSDEWRQTLEQRAAELTTSQMTVQVRFTPVIGFKCLLPVQVKKSLHVVWTLAVVLL